MREVATQGIEWVRCPVCDDDRARPLFEKQGYTVVGCQTCGVRYVNPRPTPVRLAAFYQDEYFTSGCPDASGAQHLQHREVKLATARLRLRLLQNFRASGRLVDVGCGGGFLVQAAADAGWSAVGLEPSISAARQAVHDQQVRIVAGRLEEAPFAAGRFAVVTMLDVLEHLLRPRECLAAARQLLEPGGLLLVETPNMAGWLPRLAGPRHPWFRPPEHLTYFTPSTLRAVLVQAGFRVVQLQTRAWKIVTVDYVLALSAATNPAATAVLRGTIGRLRALSRRPFRVPLAVLLAVAEAV